MNERRRLPTASESARLAQQGILDDTILYLSDDELRRELVSYRPSAQPADTFDASMKVSAGSAVLALRGDLSPAALSTLQKQLVQLVKAHPREVTLDVTDLRSITPDGMRAFVLTKEQLGPEVAIIVVGVTGEARRASGDTSISEAIRLAGVTSSH